MNESKPNYKRAGSSHSAYLSQCRTSCQALVLFIENPPVNAISNHVRRELYQSLTIAIADVTVSAIIISGAGKQFSGGADIRQFNLPASSDAPMTRDILAVISRSPKPIIAAIHGYAFGGALELALGCHFRVSTANAKLGLPEVKLGLIPGGGGTQRLSRLIGVEVALDMIQFGTHVDGTQARCLGLIDEIINGDVINGATAFAKKLIDTKAILPLAANKQIVPGSFDFEKRLSEIPKLASNAIAQHAAIESIRRGIYLPFEEALVLERRIFDELVATPESKALRQLFFAKRETPNLKRN